MPDPIDQHLGQYQIIGLIGQGGMATVYRARQESMKRDVALKIIKPSQDDDIDFVKRFEYEVQLVASLSHPHILKVFDYGQHNDLVYLVMELLSGGTLDDKLRNGPLDLFTTSRVLYQI